MLRYVTLCHVTLCHVMLHYNTIRYIIFDTFRQCMPHCITLRHAVLRCVVIKRYVRLHCVTLFYIFS